MNNRDNSVDAHCPTTLLLSAESPEALTQATQKLAAWVSELCETGSAPWPLAEVAAALRERCQRQPLPHRRAVYVQSWRDALGALRNTQRYATAKAVVGAPKLIASLPGQGSLRPGMVARLLSQAPEWTAHLGRLTQLAKDISGFDCAAWLGDARADPDVVLKDNAKTQLVIFCLAVSLGRWLRDLGLLPDAYVGHSLGEWMCAALTSTLCDEDAVRAVHHRGRLMQCTSPGAALIVREAPESLQSQLPSEATIACVNGPNMCLVSGRPDAIAKLGESLTAARLVCRPAPIFVAVHSPVMDEVIEPFLRELLPLTFRLPTTPMLSTVTGQWMPEAQARDPKYWARQLRSQVRFDLAATTLLAEPSAIVLEIGMGAALTSLLGAQFRNHPSHRALALFGRDEPPAEGYDEGRVHQTLGEVWASGGAIDLVGKVVPTRVAPILPVWV
jgi:acyl transferase domain-containing protein